MTAVPTPGHTPGHMALLLSSGNGNARMFVGDILINPMHGYRHRSAVRIRHRPIGGDGRFGIQVLDQAES